MKHWLENDAEEHHNRAASRDRLLIIVAVFLVGLIFTVPYLL